MKQFGTLLQSFLHCQSNGYISDETKSESVLINKTLEAVLEIIANILLLIFVNRKTSLLQ